MLYVLSSISVGAIVGFVFGSIYFVIFNDDPKGINRKALWWLLTLYLGIGETGGGLAIQLIGKETYLTSIYLITCTIVFMFIAIPTLFNHKKYKLFKTEIERINITDTDSLRKF